MNRIPDKNIFCKKCGRYEIELNYNCELHHVIPVEIGGTDNDGRRYLCLSCHNYLHRGLIGAIWPFVEKKEEARKAIREYTRKLLKNDPKPIM